MGTVPLNVMGTVNVRTQVYTHNRYGKCWALVLSSNSSKDEFKSLSAEAATTDGGGEVDVGDVP